MACRSAVIGILQGEGGTGLQDPDDQGPSIPIGVVRKYCVERRHGPDGRRLRRRTPAGMAAVERRDDGPAPRSPTSWRATDTADFDVFDQYPAASRPRSSITATLTLLASWRRLDRADRLGRHRDHEHHAGLRSASGPARSASARRSARAGATSSPEFLVEGADPVAARQVSSGVVRQASIVSAGIGRASPAGASIFEPTHAFVGGRAVQPRGRGGSSSASGRRARPRASIPSPRLTLRTDEETSVSVRPEPIRPDPNRAPRACRARWHGAPSRRPPGRP